MHSRLFSLVIVALAASALAACAEARPAPTTVTAADVKASEPVAEATPAAKEAEPAPAPPSESAVCRTKRPGGGTTELVLEWSGDEAKGFLRTTGASGNVTIQKVRAQKHKGMIVADDPNAADLVDHAALVRAQDGKQYMLLSDHEQIWSVCE